MKLLVIIPCYNEESGIAKTVNEVRAALSKTTLSWDILVINDKSTDRSIAVIKELKVNHIDLVINLGIGGAMQTGFKYALENDFDIAVQIDGDNQHDPNYLDKIVKPIELGDAGVVIGSRFVDKEGFQSSRMRRAGIKYFSWLNKTLIGIKIYDSTSGFRALGKEAISIVNYYYPEKYPEPESIILYGLSGIKIAEVPVIMREREGGESSIRGLKTLLYMFKVTLGTLFLFIRMKYRKRIK